MEFVTDPNTRHYVATLPGEELDPDVPLDAWDTWGHLDFETYFYDAAVADDHSEISLSVEEFERLADLVEADGDLLRWEYTSANDGDFPGLKKAGHRAYEIYKARKEQI